MPELTPLEHARAVKLRLRAASKKATEARREVSALRECDETWADLLAHGAVAQDKAGTP